MLSHIRKNWSLYAAVAFAIIGTILLFSGHAQAADPPAKAKQELVAAPSEAVKASTHGYGVLAVSEDDAIGCANKDNCILVSREAFMILIGRIDKAKAAAAKAQNELEKIQEAKGAGKCT
jgi:hypothetical protein